MELIVTGSVLILFLIMKSGMKPLTLTKVLFLSLFIFLVLLIPSCNQEEDNNSTSSSEQNISPFGLDVFLYRTAPFDMDRAATMADFAVDANVKWSREEFEWAIVEPVQGEYNTELLEAYDWVVDTHIANGIGVFGLIAYYAEWWTDYLSPSEDQHFSEYADYVRMLVTRYKGKIKYWEIWNEPNVDEFWKPRPSPENYFRLLQVAYVAAKEIDPSIKIIAFSTSGTDINFIRSVYELGGYDYLDIICIHPYSYPYAFENYEVNTINELKAMMRKYGQEKPIWVSEVGYPTHIGATGASYERQADMIVRVYLTLISLGVEVICWYDLVDDGTDIYFNEVNFGLIENDLTPKDAFTAYKTMTGLLGTSTYDDEIFKLENSQNSSKALLFNDANGDNILALWTHDEDVSGDGTITTTNKTAEIQYSGTLSQVLDINGQEIDIGTETGQLDLTISGSPVYLVGRFQITNYSLTSQ